MAKITQRLQSDAVSSQKTWSTFTTSLPFKAPLVNDGWSGEKLTVVEKRIGTLICLSVRTRRKYAKLNIQSTIILKILLLSGLLFGFFIIGKVEWEHFNKDE